MEDDQNLFADVVEEPPLIGNEQDNLQEPEDIPLAVAKKKRSLKPRPKLDTKRLMGPRGIPSLQETFQEVKFKGQGHESEDLDLLMSHLEHWAHRLYPKMTFDDCLDKIERLGHKKEIQVCMKKLRMGMPLLDTERESIVTTEDGPSHAENDGNDSPDENMLNLPTNDF